MRPTNVMNNRRPLSHEHLSQSDIDNVQMFLLFIGWPRSCHSIIGSMLDAHPNVVVAHDYFLFRKIRRNGFVSQSLLYNKLYHMSTKDDDFRNLKKGYSLHIDGSWQGQFKEVKVIGDKSGRSVVLEYMRDREKFKDMYNQLAAGVKVPIKVLQVIRNPLDMIATQTLYRGSSVKNTKVKATVGHKYRNISLLNRTASNVLNISQAIMRMVPEMGLSPLEVHCEDLIADPAKTISHICQFLDLECSADYLQMCVDKTFKNVSETRHLVEWDHNTLPLLINELRTFPFFHKYDLRLSEIL